MGTSKATNLVERLDLEISLGMRVNIMGANMNIDREELYEETERVLDALTSNEFVSSMYEFKALSDDERISFAEKVLTPKNLKDVGVEIPDGFRISSRTFEEEIAGETTGPIDYARGAVVTSQLLAKKENVERLKQHPEVLGELKALYGNLEFVPDPTLNLDDLLVDIESRLNLEINPGNQWACACGGAMTVCAGGGAGPDD